MVAKTALQILYTKYDHYPEMEGKKNILIVNSKFNIQLM